MKNFERVQPTSWEEAAAALAAAKEGRRPPRRRAPGRISSTASRSGTSRPTRSSTSAGSPGTTPSRRLLPARLDRRARHAGPRRRRPARRASRPRRRVRRRRDAADPERRDARRQPLPAPALLVLPLGRVPLPEEGRRRVLRAEGRERVPRRSSGTTRARSSTPRRQASRSRPTGRGSRRSPRAAGRTIPVADFFVTPRWTSSRRTRSADGELVDAIVVPRRAGLRSAYRKIKQKQSFDWPLADAAVELARRRRRRAGRPDRHRVGGARAVAREEGRGARRGEADRRGARRAGRGGRDRGRDAARQERVQAPARRGGRPADAARARRASRTGRKRRRRHERHDLPTTSVPRSGGRCRHLRTKMMSVVTGTGTSTRAEYPSTSAAYWCLKTMGPVGPDDGPAGLDDCRAGRALLRGRATERARDFVSGVLLAAGASTRFGSPKMLAPSESEKKRERKRTNLCFGGSWRRGGRGLRRGRSSSSDVAPRTIRAGLEEDLLRRVNRGRFSRSAGPLRGKPELGSRDVLVREVRPRRRPPSRRTSPSPPPISPF